MSTVKTYCAIVASMVVISTCGSKDGSRPDRVIPVTVAHAVQKDVPVRLKAIGNVEAFTTVAVKARVGGELEKVYFNEGEFVKEGDRLFLIDPRPYQAALEQAAANLAKDMVQAENAERDAKRYADLIDQGIVTKELYDKVRTTADALNAAMKADRAAVEDARLQLEYCHILSPLHGYTGKLMIHQGNMIKANDDNPLITINQITPVYVAFTVPEKDLTEIKQCQRARKLRVEAVIPESSVPPVAGELTFIDNTVNTATGTVLLKATFDNTDTALWPGQFVNVVLILANQPGATVVPAQAVQISQNGPHVFVVRDDRTVEMRAVEVGRELDGETLIKQGVTGGEMVITDGQMQLSTGTRVEIRNTEGTEKQGS